MSTANIRVLIVSLPGILQNILTRTLRTKSGFEVVGVATGGLSALRSISNRSPNAIVIDSNIPEGETIELLKAIQEKHPRLYSLVLTESIHQHHKMRLAGANLILRAHELEAKLDEILETLITRGAGAVPE